MPAKTPQATLDNAIELYLSGLGTYETGRRVGIHADTVSSELRRRGIPARDLSSAAKSRFASSGHPRQRLDIDEELGAALIAAGRASDAVKIYREALDDRPRRAASLLGLAQAQEAAGDRVGARATYAELSKVWAHADREVRARLH